MISKKMKGFIAFSITLWGTGCIMAGSYILADELHKALGW